MVRAALRWGLVAIAGLSARASAQTCDPDDPATAIYDLGAATYKTFEGGLYDGGTNQRPPLHDAAGAVIAESVVPLDVQGNPSPNGRVVLISIGFSNMTQEWRTGALGDPASAALAFTAKANALQATGEVNPDVLIVDGAAGGLAADNWAAVPPDLATQPWLTPVQRLAAAASSREQVQVACVKTVHLGPSQCITADGSSTGDAGVLASEFAGIARNVKTVFPNVKLCYFVSRAYAGYALTNGNPEPYAYESGFGVKWMVNAQINHSLAYGNLSFDGAGGQPIVAPWLSWGPYLWANGTTPNGLGISWSIDDFRPDDRTHPSASGVDKAGTAMLDFFLTDATTRPWFGWQCLHGDANGSGAVNARDIALFIRGLLDPAAATVAQRCRIDVNNDGAVDENDVNAFVDLVLSGS